MSFVMLCWTAETVEAAVCSSDSSIDFCCSWLNSNSMMVTNAVTGSSASATRMKLRGIFVMQPLSTAYILISIYTSMKRVTYIFMQ